MDDLNVSVYGSTQAEWRRKLRKWMDCFIFERNKEKLLSKLLKTGMKNLANECPHPPTWMKPLENGTSLSLDEMENRCIKNLIALAEMMESSAYMVAVGVRYWKYFLYDGKEATAAHHAEYLKAIDREGLSFRVRSTTKNVICSRVVASFFGDGSQVHSLFKGYLLFAINTDFPDELVQFLAPHFGTIDPTNLPTSGLSHKDLHYLCWCDFEILRSHLEDSATTVSPQKSVDEFARILFDFFNEAHSILQDLENLRAGDDTTNLDDLIHRFERLKGDPPPVVHNGATSATRAGVRNPLPVDIASFVAALRTIMQNLLQSLHFTADGLTRHSESTMELISNYFSDAEPFDPQSSMEALRLANLAAKAGDQPPCSSVVDKARLGRKLSLSDFVIYSRAGGGGYAQVFRALLKLPWLPDTVGAHLRYCLRIEMINKHDYTYFAKYCARVNLLGTTVGFHDNVCSTHAFFSFSAAGKLCFVTVLPDCHESMEDLRKREFSKRAGGKIKKEEMEIWQSVATDCCNGLQFLHDRDLIHRDFKALNVLMVYKDPKYRTDPSALVADFGDVRENVGNKTMGANTGTPVFRCPDRDANRPYGYNTDNFALGMQLYECITGDLLDKQEMLQMSANEHYSMILETFASTFHRYQFEGYATAWARLVAGLTRVKKEERISLEQARDELSLVMETTDGKPAYWHDKPGNWPEVPYPDAYKKD